mgnify:CR=1 FL=1
MQLLLRKQDAVGNDELYELFQSGFSGAIFDENMVVTTKDVAKMISMPGKVEMTGNSVKQSQKLHAEVLWVTQLCRCMDEVFQQISKENAEQPSDTSYCRIDVSGIGTL